MKQYQTTAYTDLAREFNLLVDEPLKKYTSFKIGGPADLLALPKDRQELNRLLKKARALDIPVTLFGGGTNVLFRDNGIRGLVVITRNLTANLHIIEAAPSKTALGVEAGVRLSTACRFAITHSLSGLEFAAGIPGTIGGAIMMNAGTRTKKIADIVSTLEVLDPKTLTVATIHRKNLVFSYRKLDLPGIILAATLVLKKTDPKKIKQAFKCNLAKKKASQPVSLASAGCFFKNPDQGKSAGELIENCGLKGTRVNDAMVSEKHANFIVNLNAATCEDVLVLKRKIQETVYKKYHINLKTEVRIQDE